MRLKTKRRVRKCLKRIALLLGLLTIVLLLIAGHKVAAQTTTMVYRSEEVAEPIISNEEIAKKIINEMAEKYAVSADVMYRIIECETGGTFDNAIQSFALLSYGREQSFGLAQIHLPDHPNVSIGQATDRRFAVEFLAKNLASGHGNMWSCYRKLYAKK